MMKIGNVNLQGRAVLAPMAGVTDRAFREVCADFGASYVVSEMVSSKGLQYNDKHTSLSLIHIYRHTSAILKLRANARAILCRCSKAAVRMRALLGRGLAVPRLALPVLCMLRRILIQAFPPDRVVVEVMHLSLIHI